jgi:VanZ family protein
MQIKSWHKYAIAIIYFIIITILFFLPGSVLPKNDWLSKIWFDKWVHLGLFLILFFLFSWAGNISHRNQLYLLFTTLVVYGITIEIFQDQLVSNRSFDWGDWVADILGALIGIWVWKMFRRAYVKK